MATTSKVSMKNNRCIIARTCGKCTQFPMECLSLLFQNHMLLAKVFQIVLQFLDIYIYIYINLNTVLDISTYLYLSIVTFTAFEVA